MARFTGGLKMPASLICVISLISPILITGQVLTPPYFNLAQGRNISATATCGEEVAERELFCRLTGTSNVNRLTASDSQELIQGQICDYCDPNIRDKSHPVTNAIDGTERWWQSPPLSRSQEFNKVNVTVSLGQEFHVAYVWIKSANSPNPGVWVLERSQDFGRTWQPWQYFADTPSDCLNFFNTRANERIVSDNQVVCTTRFSQVPPLTNGEIVVSLINGRPNAKNFSYALELQEWTKATDVQIRLLRTKTLLAHLMDVARQDPTVTRRYFYSIKDISIGGRCVCNGHADTCDVRNPNTQKLICNCVANTCGEQCEYCCPGFTQKRWRRALKEQPFECEPCNCHGHSNECEFDEDVERQGLSLDIHGNYEGGGVCKNCQDNTEGINCEKCVRTFYRPYNVSMNERDACKPCECDLTFSSGECEEGSGRCLCRKEFTGLDCDRCSFGYYDYPYCKPCECHINGTENSMCTPDSGACPCKENYAGAKCDQCAPGYYNFPDCIQCECDSIGSLGTVCDAETGQCSCASNFGSRDCGECAAGFYNYPQCQFCNCDPAGTDAQICDLQTGVCLCKQNYTSSRCDQCEQGFYNYPDCQECECASPGSMSAVCATNGQCRCAPNFGGRACDRCAPGYYKYPECTPCGCHRDGSLGQSCDQISGQCVCRDNFIGLRCDQCGPSLYNFPVCEVCNCNPDGAKEVSGYPLGGCGLVVRGRLCECKEQVLGRICDQCQPGYWNLDRRNPEGCETCKCYTAGTMSGINKCDMESGQCVCKNYVTGRDCDRCKNGFYNLQAKNPFGCTGCRCNLGGSRHGVCDKTTGQCPCKDRMTGQRCDQPISGYYIPDLHQLKFELEDGMTPEGARIRYGYDDRIFPKFSWRGYAILTSYQPEVVMDIEIQESSVYMIIYRYVNRENTTAKGTVTILPYSAASVTQKAELTLAPSKEPSFTKATVGISIGHPMDPGRFTITTQVPHNVFLDYFVLIPQDYYEATHLQEKITDPCLATDDAGPCVSFTYPDLDKDNFPGGFGILGYDNDGKQVGFNPDTNLTAQLYSRGLAHINETQRSFKLDLSVPKPDNYMIVVNFHNPLPVAQNLDIEVATNNDTYGASVKLPSCPYSSLCRQIMKGSDGLAGIFNISTGYATLTFTATDDNDEINVSIDSVYAIPVSKWKSELGLPRIICIMVNRVCIPSSYGVPSGSILIQFEAAPNEHLKATYVPPGIQDVNVGLVNLNDSHILQTQTNCPVSSSNEDTEKNCTTETIVQQVPLELRGQVNKPGTYMMVVHYYMPTKSKLNIPVTVYVDEKTLPGMFSPGFCPNTEGCREIIRLDQSGKNELRLQGPDVRIVFDGKQGENIWLDYLLLIPADLFNQDYLDLLPLDNSKMFITKCVDKGYRLNSTDPFCQVGAFTITTEHNNGALDCDCSPDGSLSFTCDGAGGNCRCKQNVIGRRCTACAQDFYGFPNCQPCNCQYGLCHEISGECICPPHVEGPKCDRCVRGAYGFDPLIGCQLCNCNPDGTVNNDLSCDQLTGQCNCQANVDGRRCETCVAGHYDFPYCNDCGCDPTGTIAEICDQRTAECLCKQNVQGQYCDQCAGGMFSLTTENPEGCLKCFCFGHTSRCSSAGLSWEKIMDMRGWNITNLLSVDISMEQIDNTLKVTSSNGVLNDTGLYWIAPSAYVGKKLNAYGGNLEYSMLFTLPSSGDSDSILKEDIILTGSNMTIVHYHTTQPSANLQYKFEVELNEHNFQHDVTDAPVTREQFMMLLTQMDSLVIRASYYTKMASISLKEVTMEVASTQGVGQLAESVELCECPPNYMGMSCEDCAPGSYRSRWSTPLGTCVKCNCNGHSDDCDVNTGECYNCRDNTTGPHCEQCLAGYYGEPRTGGCSICSCPLPVPSNNFATTCTASTDGFTTSCRCQPGYTGPLCDICAPGYYGDPMTPGDYCRPCGCSGNIDVSNPDSCDRFTGACLLCDNNSGGLNCGQCRDWYWGDAVVGKNCQPCACDRCGSETCDNIRGVCECKKNVVGSSCDQCAANTWGFDYCNGCNDCECGSGSVSGQCDQRTGRCECQPGVEGEKCDRCMPGHWNYGPSGCQECDCSGGGTIGCDADTGRCTCLPGVGGDKCDRCLPRWVLVPNRGCQECDYCVHLLIDDLDILASKEMEVSRTLADISVGVGAFNKLSYYNETVDILRPQVDDLQKMDLSQFKKTVDMLGENMTDLTMDTRDIEGPSTSLAFEGDALPKNTMFLKANVTEADDMVRQAEVMSSDAVSYVQDVYKHLLDSRTRNIDLYISDGERILNDIENRNFTNENSSAETDVGAAQILRDLIKDLKMNATRSLNHTEDINAQLDDIESRLQDLVTSTNLAQTDAASALATIRRLTAVQVESLARSLDKVKKTGMEREDLIKEAQSLLDDAQKAVMDAEDDIKEIESESSRLEAASPTLENHVAETAGKMDMLFDQTNQSQVHANNLANKAAEIQNLYGSTKNQSEDPVKAGQAYQNIENAIAEARSSADEAVLDADTAKMESDGISVNVTDALLDSQVLLMEAKELLEQTDNELRDNLAESDDQVDMSIKQNDEVKDQYEQVKKDLDRLNGTTTSGLSSDIMDKAAQVQAVINETQRLSQSIIDKTPDMNEKDNYIVSNAPKAADDMRQAKDSLDTVDKNNPEVVKLVDSLSGDVDRVAEKSRVLGQNVDTLKDKIARARYEANRIKGGLKFNGDTTVTLRNPPTLKDTGSYTTVSMFVLTNEPDALLLYLGNNQNVAPLARKKRSMTATDSLTSGTLEDDSDVPLSRHPRQVPDYQSDYMALELRDGRVVFTVNLGSGAISIPSNRRINDGEWHQIVAERIGKTGKLIVRTDKELDDVVEGTTRGTLAVLELNPITTHVLVGGVPEDFELPRGLISSPLIGGMEEVMFNGEPLGLWNFVRGENNNEGIRERDVLKENFVEGTRFDGKGYTVISKADMHMQPARTGVTLSFKTYKEDGILFYMSKDDFFGIWMREGRLFVGFDLGGGPSEVGSANTYNDGEWHDLLVDRVQRTGIVKIDHSSKNNENLTMIGQGTLNNLETTDDIYIGGVDNLVAPHRFVVSSGFDGCIKDLSVGSVGVDVFVDNKRSKGVTKGCAPKIIHVVSFPSSKMGYISLDPVNIGGMFDLTLKMKTTKANALLMLATDTSGTNTFSVYVHEGKILVGEQLGGESRMLASTINTYNDGEWHYVSIMKMPNSQNQNRISLSIDDTEMLDAESVPGDLLTDMPLYFGGLPPSMEVVSDAVLTTEGVGGCIGDITINKKFQNLVALKDSYGVILADCDVDKEVEEEEKEEVRPTQPTDIEPNQCALQSIASDFAIESENVVGSRFGSTLYSRQEYEKLPVNIKIRPVILSIKFKTRAQNGVMFYTSDSKHTDFLAVYMENGRVNYGFNCGSGAALITSINTYNDGQWHTVKVERRSRQGILEVDGVKEAEGKSKGATRALNTRAPYYVGGISEEAKEKAVKNLKAGFNSFPGCLDEITVNMQTLGVPVKEVDVEPCSDDVESGSYIGGDGGHVQVDDKFNVGRNLEIMMQIRPRSQEGILLAVHSTKGNDYLVLQMSEGSIIFTVDNGAGAITARYQPESQNTLCDGSWHNIKAVKSGNELELMVDDSSVSNLESGNAKVTSADTDGPLYVGGIEDPAAKGIIANDKFVGCLRNVRLNDKVLSVTAGTPTGDVRLGLCPKE